MLHVLSKWIEPRAWIKVGTDVPFLEEHSVCVETYHQSCFSASKPGGLEGAPGTSFTTCGAFKYNTRCNVCNTQRVQLAPAAPKAWQVGEGLCAVVPYQMPWAGRMPIYHCDAGTVTKCNTDSHQQRPTLLLPAVAFLTRMMPWEDLEPIFSLAPLLVLIAASKSLSILIGLQQHKYQSCQHMWMPPSCEAWGRRMVLEPTRGAGEGCGTKGGMAIS